MTRLITLPTTQIFSTTVASPLGTLHLHSTVTHLTAVELQPHDAVPAKPDVVLPDVLRQAVEELYAYFAGRLQKFRTPFAQPGTPFQQRVWSALCDIQYGEVWSYKQLAEHIGQPSAMRAVGSANARNALAIIVPCHRVIAHSGKLGGYSAGLANKEWLLKHERQATPAHLA
jgi:methylated-DNA-[protein]-cysteine S-methyltransferase